MESGLNSTWSVIPVSNDLTCYYDRISVFEKFKTEKVF